MRQFEVWHGGGAACESRHGGAYRTNVELKSIRYEPAKETMAAPDLKLNEQTTPLKRPSMGTQPVKPDPSIRFKANPIRRLDVDAVLARSLPKAVNPQVHSRKIRFRGRHHSASQATNNPKENAVLDSLKVA